MPCTQKPSTVVKNSLSAVQFFMQIDFVGMEKCLKDAKEYVEQKIAKNKGLQLSHGNGNQNKQEYEKRQKEKRSLLFNSPDVPNDPSARREYEHNNRFTYQTLVIKHRSSDQAKTIRKNKKEDIMKQRRGMKSTSSVGENLTSSHVTRSSSLSCSATGAKTNEEAFQEIANKAKEVATKLVPKKVAPTIANDYITMKKLLVILPNMMIQHALLLYIFIL